MKKKHNKSRKERAECFKIALKKAIELKELSSKESDDYDVIEEQTLASIARRYNLVAHHVSYLMKINELIAERSEKPKRGRFFYFLSLRALDDWAINSISMQIKTLTETKYEIKDHDLPFPKEIDKSWKIQPKFWAAELLCQMYRNSLTTYRLKPDIMPRKFNN